MTTRPASTPTTAATPFPAAVEAKAGEGQTKAALVTLPAPGAIPTPCPASTPSAAERTGAEAKAEEESPTRAAGTPEIPPASDRAHTAGPEASWRVSGPASPHDAVPVPAVQHRSGVPMNTPDREAVLHELARRGRRALTTEQYTRQGMLDAIRENRRRHAADPQVQLITQAGQHLAKEIAAVVDLPPADIATVLIAAGGAIGILAELYGLHGMTLAGALQLAADELDQQANGGEAS